MNNKGYTIIDMVVLIAILAVSAIIILPKVSYAFSNNLDSLYQNELNSYINIAEDYAKSNLDTLKKDGNMVISLDDLVKNGFISPEDSEGNVFDIRDNKTIINDMKLKIIYNEEDDTIEASYI